MSLIVLLVGAWAVGSWLLRPLSLQGAERFTMALLAGFCLLAVPLLVVGHWSLPAAMWATVGSVCAWLVWRARRETRRPGDGGEPTEIGPRDLTRHETACLAICIVALGGAFVTAMAPNTSWDAGVAHLALAQDYVRDGRIHVFEGNAYSAYPHLLHTLYAANFWSGGERAVALFNWTFALLAVTASYALAKRIANREAGFLGAAMVATAPLFFDQAGTCGIDLPFAALALATLVALYGWRDTGGLSWIVLAAFLIGSGSGIRHTGFVFAVLIASGLFLSAPRKNVRAVVVFGVVATLTAAPWLVRSALGSGNPFYPLFSGMFETHLPDIQAHAVGAHETVREWSPIGAALFPFDLTFRPWRYDGWMKTAGPLVLVLGIPGVFLGGKRTAALGVLAWSGALVFYSFQRMARYVFPFLAPLFAAGAVVPGRMTRYRTAVWGIAYTGMIAGIMLGFAMISFKLHAASGLQLRSAYLTERVERYPAFQWVNQYVNDNDRILTLDPRAYFLDAPTYQNFAALAEVATMAPTEQYQWLHAQDIRYVFYPLSYVQESPVFAHFQIDTMLQSWAAEEDHFEVVQELETPRRAGGPPERVLFLRLKERP